MWIVLRGAQINIYTDVFGLFCWRMRLAQDVEAYFACFAGELWLGMLRRTPVYKAREHSFMGRARHQENPNSEAPAQPKKCHQHLPQTFYGQQVARLGRCCLTCDSCLVAGGHTRDELRTSCLRLELATSSMSHSALAVAASALCWVSVGRLCTSPSVFFGITLAHFSTRWQSLATAIFAPTSKAPLARPNCLHMAIVL